MFADDGRTPALQVRRVGSEQHIPLVQGHNRRSQRLDHDSERVKLRLLLLQCLEIARLKIVVCGG